MQFNIEKTISNFVESQFPQFYLDEGPNFVLFVKAYYEWLESEGQALNQSRSIFDLRDIDNTLTAFLEHFQTKYLYGVPFNTIINKRFLLKHILDVYRSKGSINCYKLLFKLIYNQDVELYLPSLDVLRLSDGTWIQPKYLEVTNSPNLASFVGQRVIGTSSLTTATIESYITEVLSENIVATLFFSNMAPAGSQFAVGEKVVIYGQQSNAAAITQSPTVLGSLDHLQIISGGQDFNVGDVLKINQRDLSTNKLISLGVDGLLKVTSLSRGIGTLYFSINRAGFGFTSNSNIFLYNSNGDTTGNGAGFSVGSLSYTKSLQYNTDLICDYANLSINTASFGFPGNSSANATSANLNQIFQYQNNVFGSIATLTNIRSGTNYTQQPYTFVRSTTVSTKKTPGTITYSTTSNTVSGTSTAFTTYFSNNDVVYLQANSSNSATAEFQVIKQVVSDTSMVLYGPPTQNSTASALSKVASVILPSNFALYESTMAYPDGSINGINDIVAGIPSNGNNTVATAVAVNSGKGYIDGEIVTAYLTGGLSSPSIVSGGTGYANGDLLVFTGGGALSFATGYVTTDGTGAIVSATLTKSGSGYTTLPTISVQSANGVGAILSIIINEYNTYSQVIGKVAKAGVGRKQGYWSTTRGFLDSDKYIQDSYFYQDFSYQVKAGLTLDKYRDILYETFHIAGAELFGEFDLQIKEQSINQVLYDPATPIYSEGYILTSDSTYINSSDTYTTLDQVT